MQKKSPGKRHPLLLYQRMVKSLSGYTFSVGLLFGAFWLLDRLNVLNLFSEQGSLLALIGALLCLAFSGLAFLARSFSYVQAFPTHIRLVTPFLRLNISYRRIHSVHPASLLQLFPPKEVKWGERSMLEPFYGKTAVVIELSAFPLSPVLLRLFLPSLTFLRSVSGMVFIIEDWMGFSQEVDTFRDTFNQGKKSASRDSNWGRKAWGA